MGPRETCRINTWTGWREITGLDQSWENAVNERQPCFKPDLLLLSGWNNVVLSSCGHNISQETFGWLRCPICLYLNTLSWFVALYLGRISHDTAWCQISFICRVCQCPLLSLNPTIVTHHIVGILSATSVCGNMIALMPALVYAQLWLCLADSCADQGLCLN